MIDAFDGDDDVDVDDVDVDDPVDDDASSMMMMMMILTVMTAVRNILAATLATVGRKPAELEGRSTSDCCYLLLIIVIHD